MTIKKIKTKGIKIIFLYAFFYYSSLMFLRFQVPLRKLQLIARSSACQKIQDPTP